MNAILLALAFAVTNPDAAGVRATLDRYVSAWLAGDEAAVMALLTTDSVLIPGEKPPLVGRDAVRAYWFGPGAKTVLTQFTSTIDDLRVSDDLAVARGTQVIAWTSGSEHWRTRGNYMTSLRRTSAGWRIAVQMAGNTAAEKVP